MLAAILFWTCAALLVHTWLAYPALTIALARRREPPAPAPLPSLTVVIAAYDEEDAIAGRVTDVLAQDYPADRLEVVVGSDGSTDATAERARSVGDARVRVMAFERNRGKAHVHNDAIPAARGDVVVLTDAETRFAPGFLRAIAAPFADPDVGCVVGKLVYAQPGGSIARAEGAYFRLEVRLRAAESELGVLLAGTGAAMAFRRALYEPVRGDEDTDVTLPLVVPLRGGRTAFAAEAVAMDVPPSSARQEFRYRARDTALSLAATNRVAARHARALLRRPGLLLALVSHRYLRWLTPFLMLGALLANAFALAEGPIYVAAFVAQMIFYLLAAVSALPGLGRIPGAGFAHAFVVANAGILAGLARFARGGARSSWR